MSPGLITQDMGYSKVSVFYAEILRRKYTENIDYKEIDNKHELVVFYENLSVAETTLKPHARGSAKKHYIINGKTLKLMLMECGTKKAREINEYYIKVEQLAIFVCRYQVSVQKKIAESKSAEIKKRDGDINDYTRYCDVSSVSKEPEFDLPWR